MTKTDQMKAHFKNDDMKKCLKIAKTFRMDFTKAEQKIISRAHEMFSNEKMFMSMGYDFTHELKTAKSIIKEKYNL